MMRFRPTPFRWSLLPPLASAAVLIPVLSGCGGEEKFANSNTAVSDTKIDAGVSDAQGGKVIEPPSKIGKYGGTLTDAAPGDPKTFNYWVSADASSSGAVSPLYSGLLDRNSYTLEWEGALAELPTISKDGLTWTFKMKPGLKWSDGQPLTVDDVIFTMDVMYDEKVQFNGRENMMVDVPDGKGGNRREKLKYRKVDDSTIEFKFPIAYAPARDMLSFAIAPKHKLYSYWADGQPNSTKFNPVWGADVDVKDLVSCGPWILTEFKQGQRLVYSRNPYYWKKDAKGNPLPYLDHQIQLIVPDLNTMTLKFQAGETDVLGVKQDDYRSIKKEEAKGDYKVLNLGPTLTTNYLGFNMNMKSKPALANPELFKLFNETRFRQAVSQAVDREKICRNVFDNLARPGYGPETPANKLFYDPNIPKFEFNLEAARQKLADLGLKDTDGDGILELSNGKPIRFNIITNVENDLRKGITTIIAADLKKIGLDATFSPISFNTLLSRVDNKPEKGKPYPPFDWQAMVLGFTGGIEPHNGVNIWFSSGNLHQWDPYQKTPHRPWEAQIDDLYRKGARELDPMKRKAIYSEAQKIIGEQQPFIYTVVPDALVALRNKYGNIKPCVVGSVTWNLDEIYALDATRDKP